MRTLSLATAALVAASLTACGGGGDDALDVGAGTVGTSAPAPPEPVQPTGCSTARTAEVWMDERLGCLNAGVQFVNMSGGYATSGAQLADRAVILNQTALDWNYASILNGQRRYYQHFLCLRNAPPISGGSGFSSGLGADMLVVMRIASWNAMPPGVMTTTIGAYGGDRAGSVSMSCNPAQHPVIVDYSTGKIESVNPGALSSVTQYLL